MEYVYPGDARHRLEASYEADEEPFPVDTSLNFPERDERRREVGLLEQVSFPRCWNAGSVTTDADAIHETLSELGSLFCLGIRPYPPLSVLRLARTLMPKR